MNPPEKNPKISYLYEEIKTKIQKYDLLQPGQRSMSYWFVKNK